MPDGRRLVYLVSTAGIPNLGDELIAATWLGHLAENEPDADVVLDCIDPAAVSPSLRRRHPRLRVVSTLWQLCFRYWNLGADATVLAEAAVAAPSREARLRDGLELLLDADVVHITGGGFLNRMWPPFLGLLSAVVAAGGRSGATTAMTGVGLCPPVPGVEDLLAVLAARLDVADVRDAASARLLGSRASYSCDDVFLRLGERYARDAAALPDAMVSVQFAMRPATLFPPSAATDEQAPEPVTARGLARLSEFVSKTIAEWGAQDVGIVECWPRADRAVVAAVRQALPQARFFSLGDVMRDGFPARPGQAWLSSRFHPHLLAAAAGASGVAVTLEQDYYATKHASLLEHGSSWGVAPYAVFAGAEPPVPPRPAAGGFAPERLAAHRAAKARVAERIYGR